MFASAIAAREIPAKSESSTPPDRQAYEEAIRNEDLGAPLATLGRVYVKQGRIGVPAPRTVKLEPEIEVR